LDRDDRLSDAFPTRAVDAGAEPDAATLPIWTSGNSRLPDNASSNQVHYSWKTPSQKGSYSLRIALADGSTQVADFHLEQQ
jgi:hypothetical protein